MSQRTTTALKRSLLALSILFTLALTSNKTIAQCSVTSAFAFTFQQCSTVQFADLSSTVPTYTIIQWDWDFDDGTTSTVQNPVHTFAPGATYVVTLTVTADSSGVTCTDQSIHAVIAPALPSVYFTYSPDITCLGSPTSFFGTAGNPIVSWNWNFGDGQFSTIQNPIHLYTYADVFSVTLTVEDVNGCQDTIIRQIVVADIPDISILVDPNPTCLNMLTDFSGSSSAMVTSWDWDFGDGGIAYGQNTTHAYTAPGNYYVTLTVDDTSGCANTETELVIVNPLPAPNFDHNGPVCETDSVEFFDLSTTPNGYIVIWEWDFGDGNTTTVNFPNSPNVSHYYGATGTFQVTLTVTDSDSCQNSTLKNVNVVPDPVANFTNSTACDGDPVQFTDLSSINNGGNIVSWLWDFADPASGVNNSSNLQNPTHVFTSAGSYNVSLTVTNINGCTDSFEQPVSIATNPSVEINSDSDTTCVGNQLQFYGISASAISWFWDFGDGGTSALQDPAHVFQSVGNYTVTLTVTDNDGCTNDTSKIIYVNPEPNSMFSYTTPACSGSDVTFIDQSNTPTGYVNQWHWYFGDGSDTIVYFPDNPDVDHTYTLAGSYIVSLVITNSTGCTDSTSAEVIIGQGPDADFITDGATCEDHLIQFLDQSAGFGYPIQAWYWNFDDPSSGSNNISNLQNPYHMFNYPGTYDVFLEVTSSNGCIDSVSMPVEILPPPDVWFNFIPQIICQDDTVYFNIDPDTVNVNTITSYFWDFGDPQSGSADTSSLQNPWHIFTGFGTYTVSLSITDTSGCDNSVSIDLEVNLKPTANYSFENNCGDDSTRFLDQSLIGNAPINEWFWKFGDPSSSSNTSTLQNPYHQFSNPDAYFVTLKVTDSLGCYDTIRQAVSIFDNPTAAYIFNQICEPEGTVHFNDQSTSGISGSPIQEWLWEIDDGYFSTEVNPVYTYSITDTCYEVILTVTDANNCTDVITDTVCVFENLQVDFGFNQVCQKQRTFFTTSFTPSDDSIVSYNWDFGDGSNIITHYDTISHLFGTDGVFMVTLTAVDIHNCTHSIFHLVTIDPLPIPDFSYDIVFCNNATQFYDQSSGNGHLIIDWLWDFDDPSSPNNTSTLKNPQHTYSPYDSTYNVKLIVTNDIGCIDSIIKPVIKGACIQADFGVEPDPLCHNAPVCFTDSSTYNGSTGIISQWTWDFGDGNTYSTNIFEAVVCHEYNSPGAYLVSLIIEAGNAPNVFTDTAKKGIFVYRAPTSGFSLIAPCTNHNTLFINETNANNTTIASYFWDFGDLGSTSDTSSKKDPEYTYHTAGYYYPELTSTNTDGCSDTFTDTIRIYPPPDADFAFTQACMKKPTLFTDETAESGGPAIGWFWNFNDPTSSYDTSILQNPTYIYDTTGYYNVTFIVQDSLQCFDTIVKEVEIFPIPYADFSWIDNYKDKQGQLKFEDESTGNVTAYLWDFDNGETSEEINPVINFIDDGTYLIELIVTNKYGCPDTIVKDYKLLFKGLFVPNAFVPGSSQNGLKEFKPSGINLQSYSIEIYSLWGNKLWSSTAIDEEGMPAIGWNGKYDEEFVPAGIYIWKIYATFKDNTIWNGMPDGFGNYNKSGTITIVR